jgi:molybdate transport system regulatory protein
MTTTKQKLLLNADGRSWITTPEGKFVGKGHIELLEKISRFGSLRQAALAMKMSYNQAWLLINDMNAKARTPLVISSRGGKGGGRAEVTEKGEQLIVLFTAFNEKFHQFLAQQDTVFIF